MFKVIKYEGKARRGRFKCAHGGGVQTPVFMNVGTQAAIKGGVSALDLKDLGCQIELSNTYHLHLRPGDDVVRQMGGLHKFMHWDGPILTDSGGFQVFSLAGLRKIKEEGVTFASHLDGRRIFMGPEESMRIQSNLGSDIAMAFDECVENPAQYDYAKASCERTLRWLQRCKAEHDRLNALPDTVNPHQMLFGINQGATYEDLRIWHMQQIARIGCDGFAIGGEQSGHTIFRAYATTGDGELTALQFLQTLRRSGVPASQLAARCPQYPQELINVEVPHTPGVKERIMADESLHQETRRWEEKLGGQGRILIRPSGTEALIRVMVEAKTTEIAHQVASVLADFIKKL